WLQLGVNNYALQFTIFYLERAFNTPRKTACAVLQVEIYRLRSIVDHESGRVERYAESRSLNPPGQPDCPSDQQHYQQRCAYSVEHEAAPGTLAFRQSINDRPDKGA